MVIEGSKFRTFDRETSARPSKAGPSPRASATSSSWGPSLVEVEAEHHVQRLAVEDADRQEMGGQFQDHFMLGIRVF